MPTHSRTTILLATDVQNSVLNALDANQPHPIAYTPYGHHTRENGLLSLLGFNGELSDPLTGHYHLGNGYRQFNPVLKRFNSPDSWSPFGRGGLNAYAYCGGDPRNRNDPTGHVYGLNTALKSAGMGISKQSKAISKSASIGKYGRRSANASSTSVETATTASGSAIAASPATKVAEVNNAVARININEPIADTIGNYTTRINISDMATSANHFNEALKNYPFIRLRRNPNVLVPDVTTPRLTNTGQLDVYPFDVSISLFRNVADFRNQRIPGDGRSMSILADVQEIRRANYIRTHTGINLLL
ncbi:RHS repeat-associated core domain-containing protein [Pseudomonas sp. LB3P81]